MNKSSAPNTSNTKPLPTQSSWAGENMMAPCSDSTHSQSSAPIVDGTDGEVPSSFASTLWAAAWRPLVATVFNVGSLLPIWRAPSTTSSDQPDASAPALQPPVYTPATSQKHQRELNGSNTVVNAANGHITVRTSPATARAPARPDYLATTRSSSLAPASTVPSLSTAASKSLQFGSIPVTSAPPTSNTTPMLSAGLVGPLKSNGTGTALSSPSPPAAFTSGTAVSDPLMKPMFEGESLFTSIPLASKQHDKRKSDVRPLFTNSSAPSNRTHNAPSSDAPLPQATVTYQHVQFAPPAAAAPLPPPRAGAPPPGASLVAPASIPRATVHSSSIRPKSTSRAPAVLAETENNIRLSTPVGTKTGAEFVETLRIEVRDNQLDRPTVETKRKEDRLIKIERMRATAEAEQRKQEEEKAHRAERRKKEVEATQNAAKGHQYDGMDRLLAMHHRGSYNRGVEGANSGSTSFISRRGRGSSLGSRTTRTLNHGDSRLSHVLDQNGQRSNLSMYGSVPSKSLRRANPEPTLAGGPSTKYGISTRNVDIVSGREDPISFRVHIRHLIASERRLAFGEDDGSGKFDERYAGYSDDVPLSKSNRDMKKIEQDADSFIVSMKSHQGQRHFRSLDVSQRSILVSAIFWRALLGTEEQAALVGDLFGVLLTVGTLSFDILTRGFDPVIKNMEIIAEGAPAAYAMAAKVLFLSKFDTDRVTRLALRIRAGWPRRKLLENFAHLNSKPSRLAMIAEKVRRYHEARGFVQPAEGIEHGEGRVEASY